MTSLLFSHWCTGHLADVTLIDLCSLNHSTDRDSRSIFCLCFRDSYCLHTLALHMSKPPGWSQLSGQNLLRWAVLCICPYNRLFYIDSSQKKKKINKFLASFTHPYIIPNVFKFSLSYAMKVLSSFKKHNKSLIKVVCKFVVQMMEKLRVKIFEKFHSLNI